MLWRNCARFSLNHATPMKPDTAPPDKNGDAALEALLGSLPRHELPPEWRDPILRGARPPAWPWFTRPVRWSLAACWAAIAAFHFTAPPGPAPLPPGAYASPPTYPMSQDIEKYWLAEHAGNSPELDLLAP